MDASLPDSFSDIVENSHKVSRSTCMGTVDHSFELVNILLLVGYCTLIVEYCDEMLKFIRAVDGLAHLNGSLLESIERCTTHGSTFV